nr:MAG TPA: PcfM DpnD/PcfM-like protein [Caudoviricetes sp.]
MKEYQVEITETRTTIITVRANSEEEAEKSARQGYDKNEYEVTTLDGVCFDVLN